MSDLRKIIVDGKEVEVPISYTLLQAAEKAGAERKRGAVTACLGLWAWLKRLFGRNPEKAKA